jgi:hypothetical protein
MIGRELAQHLALMDQLEARTVDEVKELFSSDLEDIGGIVGREIAEAVAKLQVGFDMGQLLAKFLALGAARVLELANRAD